TCDKADLRHPFLWAALHLASRRGAGSSCSNRPAEPRRRPAIGEEAVDGIMLIDFAIDGRHLLGEIRAKHAGRKQPGALAVRHGRPILVPFEPLWMGFQRI